MTAYIIFGIIAVVMLFIGIFIGKSLGKLKQQSVEKSLESEVSGYRLQLETSEKNLQELKNERESLRSEKDFFKDELTRKNVEFDNLQQRNKEQKLEVEQLQEKFQKEFENLAHKIFDQNSEKFTHQNKENIQHILNPLQEKIKVFEEKVEKNSLNSVKINAELSKQLQFLNEQNLKISEEATNLTKALKGDTKMQGNWGEMVLERVLERSGLQTTQNRDFVDGPDGLPLMKPPYGRITAISMETGEHLWIKPIGRGYEQNSQISNLTFSDYLGVPQRIFTMTTKNLLISGQQRLSAFNLDTGNRVGEVSIPESVQGNIMGYELNDKLYLVIPIGGSGSTSELIAYTLN